MLSVKAEVESSNTVGYTKINLSTGYTTLAPAFYSVGQDTIDISAMEVVDGMDQDSLSLLDSTGNTVSQYYWFNAFEDPDSGDSFPAMWALDSLAETEAVGISFDLMEGFLFYSAAPTAKFKHYGEVLEDNVAGITLNKGYTVLGNPYNKTLPLENLVPVNALDQDSLSLLDSTGNVVAQYYWFNAFEDADSGDSFPAMWALDSLAETEATGVTFDPDEAFLFYSAATTAALNVTAP